MTKKIYDYNANMFEFKANVKKCEKNEKGLYEIILDETAFFCGGGGQERDYGKIGGNDILDIYEKDNEIYHIISVPLNENEEIIGKINKEKRFKYMQLHSGEHLVSGIIHNIYGYDNVGFHLGKDFVTMDVDGVLTKEDLKKIELLANKAVWENVPFKVYYPAKKELEGLEYRSKLELTQNVRIVEIEGYDKCACCAPHVSFSGQIGLIKLLDVTRINKGSRIRMLSGSLALEDYFQKYEITDNISTLLSVKHNDVYNAVSKINSALEEKNYEIVGLKRQIYEYKYNDIKDKNNILVFEEKGDFNELLYILNLLKKSNEGIIGIFSGNDEKGYNYILESENEDFGELKEGFFKELNAKGGGKSNHIQGFVKAECEKIKKYFQSKNIDIFTKE